MTSIGDRQVPIVLAGNECEKDEEQVRSQIVKGFDGFWPRKSLMHSESETKRHFGEDVPLGRQDLIFCLNELLKLQVDALAVQSLPVRLPIFWVKEVVCTKYEEKSLFWPYGIYHSKLRHIAGIDYNMYLSLYICNKIM